MGFLILSCFHKIFFSIFFTKSTHTDSKTQSLGRRSTHSNAEWWLRARGVLVKFNNQFLEVGRSPDLQCLPVSVVQILPPTMALSKAPSRSTSSPPPWNVNSMLSVAYMSWLHNAPDRGYGAHSSRCCDVRRGFLDLRETHLETSLCCKIPKQSSQPRASIRSWQVIGQVIFLRNLWISSTFPRDL